ACHPAAQAEAALRRRRRTARVRRAQAAPREPAPAAFGLATGWRRDGHPLV
ncbi:MAG: hypothetical protein AVDCRST_MAG23-464, partial [uncultured Sphingosinicella sp.]